MEPEPLLAFVTNHRLTFFMVGLIIIGSVFVWIFFRLYQRQQVDHDILKERVDTMWRDMDDIRVQQFNGASRAPSDTRLPVAQFEAEKAIYEKIWPLVWGLHDKLGIFLRAVEASEPPGDSRVTARNAALDARSVINGLRPFYDEEVDDLLTRLIDTEIKVHLAACQYIDHKQGDLPASPEDDAARAAHRQKFRLLYDGEARELMNRLVHIMRRRMVRRVD